MTEYESKIVRKTMRVTEEGGRKMVDEQVIFEELETPKAELRSVVHTLFDGVLDDLQDAVDGAERELEGRESQFGTELERLFGLKGEDA